MENANEEYTFKVLLLGESGVGKTQLRLRFVKDAAPTSTEPTFGVDFASRILSIEKSAVRLQLWDTAGMKRYRHHNPAMVYRHSVCALLIYDVTAKESFQSLQQWVDELNAASDVDPSRMVLVVVGNKTDLPDRQVTTEEGKQYADSHNYLFREISSQKSQEVDDLFRMIAGDILNRIEDVDHSESTLSDKVVGDISPPASHSEVVVSTPEMKSPKIKLSSSNKKTDSPSTPAIVQKNSPARDDQKENIKPEVDTNSTETASKPKNQTTPKTSAIPTSSPNDKVKGTKPSTSSSEKTAAAPQPTQQQDAVDVQDLPGPPTRNNKKGKTEQCQCCSLQ